VKDTETVGEHGTGVGEDKRFWWVRLQDIDTCEGGGVDRRLMLN